MRPAPASGPSTTVATPPSDPGASGAAPPRRGIRTAASTGLVIAWSSGFIGAELGHRADAAPLPLLTWRFALLSLLLLTVCAVTRTSLRSWRAWRRQTALALLSQVIYLVLVFEGVSQGVHGGTAALIAALQPLLVMTVAGRLLGESASRWAWLGTGIGFVGVLIVVSGDIGATDVPHWAYLFPAVAMVSLSAGTVLARRLDPPESLLQTITMQSVITGIAYSIASLSTGHLALPHGGETLAAVAWLVFLPSIAGYGLYTYVTHTAGATVVSTLLYLTPPTTMLWAYLMFGDAITLPGLIGLAVSATGVVLVLRSRRPTPAP